MASAVGEALSAIKGDSGLETQRFRQAVYIAWATIKMKMPDPCGQDPAFQLIASCFLHELIAAHNPRSMTLRGYMNEINTLFQMRGFPHPADFNVRNNMCVQLFHALKTEEDVARKRDPISNQSFAELKKLADALPKDSAEAVVFQFFCLIRITGLRRAEYAQKTQTTVQVHTYPVSKRTVVMAFIRRDWTFYDKRGNVILQHSEAMLVDLGKVRITFRIQKNRQNGQTITVVADLKHPEICPVRNAYLIYLRSIRLQQPDDSPMGVFLNKQGQKKYLTGSKIADVLQAATKIAHPSILKDDLSKISAHSGRVWALVLLDEAGKKPDFMKSRLRWLGDSYRHYLRDTATINEMHNKALEKTSAAVMALLGSNADALPDVVPEDESMGTYEDDTAG